LANRFKRTDSQEAKGAIAGGEAHLETIEGNAELRFVALIEGCAVKTQKYRDDGTLNLDIFLVILICEI